MSKVRMRSADSDSVGQSGGDYFKPDKIRQRIALVPYLIPKSELEISDELKKKAIAGDVAAQNEVEDISELKSDILDGLKSKPGAQPRTKEYKLNMGTEEIEGYLFPRVDSHMTHYLAKEKMSFFCKKEEYEGVGRPPVCCNECAKDPQDRGAYLSYAVVVLVYETTGTADDCSIVELPLERQKTLDAENRLDFRYSMRLWGLSDGKIKGWKSFSKGFPLICSDYEVWTEKVGNADRVKFAPCQGQALWTQRGMTLQNMILKEGRKLWDENGGAARTIGRNFSLEEIDKMFGITPPKRGGGGSNEVGFSNLLNS